MNAFCRYEWPGNVRELMNVIERALLLCNGDEISLSDLPHVFNTDNLLPGKSILGGNEYPLSWKGKTLAQVKGEVIDQVERLYLEMILKETHGRVAKAAHIANIHSRGMYNKMKRLNVKKEDFRSSDKKAD